MQVLGDSFQSPEAMYLAWCKILTGLDVCLSLLTVALWVFQTYRQTVEDWMKPAETALAAFFIFNYLTKFLKYEFSPDFVLSFDSFIDLSSIVILLLVHNTWLSWSYTRMYSAYTSVDMLVFTLGWNPLDLNEVTLQILLTELKFVSMLVMMAGSMFLVEVLGDIQGFEDQFIEAEMGDISFFSMIYMIMITISTVGFGDLSPATLLGRTLIMGCILYGVVFFANETSRLSELQQQENSGKGRYRTRRKGHAVKHVVIFGGWTGEASTPEISTMLKTLQHDIHSDDLPPDVVLVSSCEPPASFGQLLKSNAGYASRVHLLQGSPFIEEDLDRCRLRHAALCYVMPRLDSTEPEKDDENAILMAASITKVYPKLPFRLILLRPESRNLAMRFNINRRNSFSLFEFKANLLAQSVRCPGLSTVLLSLAGHDPKSCSDKLRKAHPWINEYNAGAEHTVFGGMLKEEFCGISFTSCVKKVYTATQALLIACQVGSHVVTNPGRKLIVEENMVVFFIAKSRAQLQSAIQPGSDWKRMINKMRLQATNPDELLDLHSSFHFLRASSTPTTPTTKQDLEPEKSLDVEEFMDADAEVPGTPYDVEYATDKPHWMEGKKKIATAAKKAALVVRLGSRFTAISSDKIAETEMREFHFRPPPAGVVPTLPGLLSCNKGHIVMLAVGERLNQQITAFLQPLRSSSILVWKEIIVVSNDATMPWRSFEKFEGVHFIFGDPKSYQTLKKAAIEDAEKVVILDSFRPCPDNALLDKNTVLCCGVVRGYLQRFPASDISVLTVLNNPDSIKQIAQNVSGELSHRARARHTTQWQRMRDLTDLRRAPSFGHVSRFLMSWNKIELYPPHLHPQFVSGDSMSLTDLVGWAGHAYNLPGFMELMECLLLPEGIDGDFPMPSMLWMMDLEMFPNKFATWGEMAEYCIDTGAIPLACSKDSDAGVLVKRHRYVVTNPSSDTNMAGIHEVMVLAPPRWAYSNSIANPIIQTFSSRRARTDAYYMLMAWQALVKSRSSTPVANLS
ncbi:hypothetical protein CYMTET_20944 [Cymbomonas tetramitiformis]|uniref:Calcium-activated potassium channel subunit alpha-1 n=1 Tax=Cymbomonas tetramitiformis TaxID=36881 RepID=A0AAE0G356_9CHLO|nr:hypothetical protein CYMTET_20944 [Cymbomonas tetramitiformis]